jgi:hypothetical protein
MYASYGGLERAASAILKRIDLLPFFGDNPCRSMVNRRRTGRRDAAWLGRMSA